VQTSDWNEVYSKVVAIVESFPMICRTWPKRKEIGSIPDF
jgi:hypothetical protein